MPRLSFSHPDLSHGPVLKHGATEITWSYNMNAVAFPTYGGEVVQILSVNIGDVTMTGQFTSYEELEFFYKWFIDYLQIASQGHGEQRVGTSAYNQTPVTFNYPHRGWQIQIIPTQLPGFLYGRDVVVPTWQLQAFVVDAQDDVGRIEDLIRDNIAIDGLAPDQGDFTLEGEIGYIDSNPWSSPFPNEKTFNPSKTHDAFAQIADYYDKLIPAYLDGDFSSLTSGLYSKPAFYDWGNPSTTDTSTDQAKKKVKRIRAGNK